MNHVYILSSKHKDFFGKEVSYFYYNKVHSTEKIAWSHENDFREWLVLHQYAIRNTIEVFCDELILEE